MQTSPRPSCPDCVRKHLAQACVLCQEAKQGYPEHRWLAIGHMAEAEAEIEGVSPEIAEGIRDERKALEQDDSYCPPFLEMIKAVSGMFDEGVSCGCDRLARIETKVAASTAIRFGI